MYSILGILLSSTALPKAKKKDSPLFFFGTHTDTLFFLLLALQLFSYFSWSEGRHYFILLLYLYMPLQTLNIDTHLKKLVLPKNVLRHIHQYSIKLKVKVRVKYFYRKDIFQAINKRAKTSISTFSPVIAFFLPRLTEVTGDKINHLGVSEQ